MNLDFIGPTAEQYARYMAYVLPPPNDDEREYVVYWLYDSSCQRPSEDGYVGVTLASRFRARMLEHQRSERFIDRSFEYKIILRDHGEGCYSYEHLMRPMPHMGWNLVPGGARGNKLKKAHSALTRKRIGLGNTGKKRPDLAVRNTINKQEIFCVGCHERASKSKLLNSHNKCYKMFCHMEKIVCPHCDLEGSGPNMTRYHFNKCKFMFVDKELVQ